MICKNAGFRDHSTLRQAAARGYLCRHRDPCQMEPSQVSGRTASGAGDAAVACADGGTGDRGIL